MVLDTSLLNTRQYKACIKGKVEQSRERSSALPTPQCSSYWKGSLPVAFDNSRQLTYLLLLLSYSLRVDQTTVSRRSFTGVSKSPQVSRTFISILADLNDVVFWIVLIRPPIFNSSSTFSRHLGTVSSVPITMGNIVSLKFHNFLSSLARSKYLCLFSFSFIFTLWSVGRAKSTIRQVIFFLSLGLVF